MQQMRAVMTAAWFFEDECSELIDQECARSRGVGLPGFVAPSVVEAIYAARELMHLMTASIALRSTCLDA